LVASGARPPDGADGAPPGTPPPLPPPASALKPPATPLLPLLPNGEIDPSRIDTALLYDVLQIPTHLRSELGDELMVHGFDYSTLTYVLIVKHSVYFLAVAIYCVFLVFSGNDGAMPYHRYSWYRS
jgi:hypothetical protein